MVVRPGEPPTSPARPHLVMQLRAGWRHVAPRRRFERGAEHFSPKGLPPRSRFLPLAPELAAKNEKSLSQDERVLARTVRVVLPPTAKAADYLELVGEWPCVENAWISPEVSLP